MTGGGIVRQVWSNMTREYMDIVNTKVLAKSDTESCKYQPIYNARSDWLEKCFDFILSRTLLNLIYWLCVTLLTFANLLQLRFGGLMRRIELNSCPGT